MIKRDEAGEYVGIQCNQCDTMAPPASEIDKAHGLIGMGWHCSGGTHICPGHEHPVIPPMCAIPVRVTRAA